LFSNWSQSPAFDRSLKNGFRCVLYVDSNKIPDGAFEPRIRQTIDFYKEEPVPDPIFKIYKDQFSYDKTDLSVQVESRDESSEEWTLEKISFDTAYGKERMPAYLFLPKNSPPPYQTVVYFPGQGSYESDSSKNLDEYWEYEKFLSFIVANGRAVLYPVYQGTFERKLKTEFTLDSYQYVEYRIQLVKDFRRSVDYLETRPDIDIKKLAYMGFSWGTRMAPLILAVEDRLKTAIMLVGGLETGRKPEVNNSSYVRKVKIPALMLSGRFDMAFPYLTSSKPMFDLLGTSEEDKVQKIYETDHFVPLNEHIKETLAWLDRYLGPVNR
jgi:dienelactone hydrolase